MLLTYVPQTRPYFEELIGDGSQFLSDLEKKLRPIGLKDRENLLAIKKEEHAEKGYPFDGEFYIWDYRYYDRKFIEKSLDLDDSLVKEYFPVTVVVPTILDIYQRLLSVRFVALETETWHPGVYLKFEGGGMLLNAYSQMSGHTRYGRRTRKTNPALWAIHIWTCIPAVCLH